MDGRLQDALGGGQYSVLLEDADGNLDQEPTRTVRGRLSGKMKKNHIRVLPGDRVRVAFSPYDMSHGIIVRRHRK